MFENLNGDRPQLNCQVCNTGDIHINGLKDPHSMVLIDGMPIVSSLYTVYGLSGIRIYMVECIEVAKGFTENYNALAGARTVKIKNLFISLFMDKDYFNKFNSTKKIISS